MKTIKNNEIKKESIMTEIKDRKEEVKVMISWLNEWKDSKDMEELLLNNIRKAKFKICMLETRLKVINLIQGFKNKVTA